VVFGVGRIWATYLVGRQVSTTNEALLSAALLTFSYHLIWFSQNARGYTGVLYWRLLSSWFFIRGLSYSRTYIWLPYALSAALGIYTQVSMIFVVIGHFLIYTWKIISSPNKQWVDWAISFLFGFCLAALITIALYALALPQALTALASGVAGGLTIWSSPQWTIIEMVRAMKMSFGSRSIAAIFGLMVFQAYSKNLRYSHCCTIGLRKPR
jgi:mannosyltransferase